MILKITQNRFLKRIHTHIRERNFSNLNKKHTAPRKKQKKVNVHTLKKISLWYGQQTRNICTDYGDSMSCHLNSMYERTLLALSVFAMFLDREISEVSSNSWERFVALHTGLWKRCCIRCLGSLLKSSISLSQWDFPSLKMVCWEMKLKRYRFLVRNTGRKMQAFKALFVRSLLSTVWVHRLLTASTDLFVRL